MATYRVQLDAFAGPLDLLLYLVKRNELDILNLPVARITQQFLDYLNVLELIDLDTVGDFIVMAATLMEIKSREALPRTDVAEQAEDTPGDDTARSELVEQLLEYKRFKDAGQKLEERAAQWQERFPRLHDDRPQQGRDHSEDAIKEVELWDLVSALARMLQKKVVEESSSIRYDDTPISVYVERIGASVRERGKVAFSEFFEGTNERSKIVGIFLAVLELLRHHAFRAQQAVEFGEIDLLPPLETPQMETTAPPVGESHPPQVDTPGESALRDE